MNTFRAKYIPFYEWDSENKFFNMLFERLPTDLKEVLDPVAMTNAFNYNYSHMNVLRKALFHDKELIIDNIMFKYDRKWQISYELMYNKIKDGASSYRESTNRESLETTKDIVKELTREVGAFNTDTLTEDNRNNDGIEELLKNIVDGNRTETTYTMFSIQQHLSIIRKGFNDMILQDIANELLIQIY